MRVDVTEEGYLKLSDLFTPVVISSDLGDISISSRDGGIEIMVGESLHSVDFGLEGFDRFAPTGGD